MTGHCPDCGSKLNYFRSGLCLTVRCDSSRCRWEAVTSFPVPLRQDPGHYTLRIPALSDAAPAILMALNQRFSHGIATTRRLARLGELPPIQGRASEIWSEAIKLRAAGIPFSIVPDYPFDLDDPTSAFGPPDGRLPDSTVENLLG